MALCEFLSIVGAFNSRSGNREWFPLVVRAVNVTISASAILVVDFLHHRGLAIVATTSALLGAFARNKIAMSPAEKIAVIMLLFEVSLEGYGTLQLVHFLDVFLFSWNQVHQLCSVHVVKATSRIGKSF